MPSVIRKTLTVTITLVTAVALGACGPRAHIPARPAPASVGLPVAAPLTQLARALAPVLYRHPNETFPLARAVAVVHPDHRVIGYHLLWQDDAHGAWIPFTVPTDEEIVWVGYDESGAPTRVWTYWHGNILSTPWRHRQVAIDVQWGKHGSLPRGTVLADLPRGQSLKSFHRFTWMLPDLWLGRLTRQGPGCFCGSYARYAQFTDPLLLADRLDAVVVAGDPHSALQAVFGRKYSEKPAWPWQGAPPASLVAQPADLTALTSPPAALRAAVDSAWRAAMAAATPR
jgi:hypothetical protein